MPLTSTSRLNEQEAQTCLPLSGDPKQAETGDHPRFGWP